MTKNQRGTLEAIFADPVRANISWHDVESLLRALGAELTEGRGSRVRIFLDELPHVIHRPHPGHEIGKATVRDLRGFLRGAGLAPEE